jgi:hypothetical protein
MRPYLAALFLSSCAMLASSPNGDRPARPPFPAVDPDSIPGTETSSEAGRQEGRKPRPRLSPTPPASAVSSCASLDAGDLKETIKAKLDCIKDNAK